MLEFCQKNREVIIMELTIDKSKRELNQKYNLGLSNWELILWQNMSLEIKDYTKIAETLRKQYTSGLEKLYSIADNPDYFTIKVEGNKELDKVFVSELVAARKKGLKDVIKQMEDNEVAKKEELATTCTQKQYQDYVNLVKILKQSNHSDEFKYLILNEVLSRTYSMDFTQVQPKILVDKRIIGESLNGVMNFTEETLNYIHDNVENYTAFKNLYLNALVESNKKIVKQYEIKLDGVDTSDKGYWIKFPSRSNDQQNFKLNGIRLQLLSFCTPWCTSSSFFVEEHLMTEDFYVFLDHDNQPHIAILMGHENIEEVRGIQNGWAQEVEPEYRAVAIEFLKKNESIKNAEIWLEREEWFNRVTRYLDFIDSGKIGKMDMAQLWEDFNRVDEQEHSKKDNLSLQFHKKVNMNNALKEKLLDYLELVENGKYKGEEIYFGNNLKKDIDTYMNATPEEEAGIVNTSKIKVVVGNVRLDHMSVNLSKVEHIFGNLWGECNRYMNLVGLKDVSGTTSLFRCSNIDLSNWERANSDVKIVDCSNIKADKLPKIYGNANLALTEDLDMSGLVEVDGNMDCRDTRNVNLQNLKEVGGFINLFDIELSKVPNLKKAKSIHISDGKYPDISGLDVETVRKRKTSWRETSGEEVSKEEYMAEYESKVGGFSPQ